MDTKNTDFVRTPDNPESEVLTTRDVSEGGVIGGVGGTIVGGLAGGPVGAIFGAAAGIVASAAAVDAIDVHEQDLIKKIGPTTHIKYNSWEPEMGNPIDTIEIDEQYNGEGADLPQSALGADGLPFIISSEPVMDAAMDAELARRVNIARHPINARG